MDRRTWDKTWQTVDRLARKLAADMQAEVTTSVENGIDVSRVVAEGVTVRYATRRRHDRRDERRRCARDPRWRRSELAESEDFLRAAEDVGLEDRTKGFVYVDVDGMLPLIEDLAGESIPPDVRDESRLLIRSCSRPRVTATPRV